MTAPEWLSALFPAPDSVIYYTGSINGKPFARQWMLPAERIAGEDDGHPFESFVELDPKPMGGGGSIIQQRTRLLLHSDHSPHRYLSQARGARVMLGFEPDTVAARLPDGQVVQIPRGDAEWITEANMTGMDAMLFSRLHHEGRIVDGEVINLFFLNQLVVIPYTLSDVSTAADGTITCRSSHDEVITIGPEGILTAVVVEKQGVELRREDPPPLPEWRHEAAGGTAPKKLATYTPPADRTFTLEDVQIPATRSPVGGTLSIPAGDGPFPAVLFLGGTGTKDRHGIAGEVDLGTHEILDFLAENGVLGLRYDSRGAGQTDLGASPLSRGLAPLLDDARSALAYLRGRDEVDTDNVMLVGHSQGGTLAMSLAAEDHAIGAIVLMASIGRTLEQLLIDQISAQGEVVEMSAEQTSQQQQDLSNFIELVRQGARFEPGEVPDRMVPYARMADWVKEHMEHDPRDLMKKIRCPVLIAQGEKDFQVLMSDAEALVAAAGAAGVSYTLMTLPDLDHLFKPIEGKSTLESYYSDRRVDRDFLDQLLAWLRSA